MTEIELQAELNDLRMSKDAQPLFDAVKRHIAENVDPITEEFFRLGENRADRWSWAPGQLELLEEAVEFVLEFPVFFAFFKGLCHFIYFVHQYFRYILSAVFTKSCFHMYSILFS